MKNTIYLNIGANVNGKERFTLGDVELALVCVGFTPISSRTSQSDTEKTFAFECVDKHELAANQCKQTVKRLACLLQQDAIACIIQGKGELIGDKAHEWGGKFLPALFISVK